jgi:hypothetical protein
MGSVAQGVIVAAATDTLNGRRSSLGAAWMTVGGQLPRIVLFGVVYAGERTFTATLRGRRWSIGTLAANIIDRAWDFATFLTIPVLLYEDLPVFKAVARSGKLVAKRWGVQLTARSVLGIALFVVVLPATILGLAVAVSMSVVLGTAIIVITILTTIVTTAALNGRTVSGALPLRHHRERGPRLQRGRDVVGLQPPLRLGQPNCAIASGVRAVRGSGAGHGYAVAYIADSFSTIATYHSAWL